ncbi:MAG TPA: GNAT family N-acetyltransferase [Mobilitalea sp.]|nr:GNAT family N-acetyltransferase [Mobilitalea sp.]
MIEIHNLTSYKYEWIQGAAALLNNAFPHSYTNLDEAKEEVYKCLEKGKIALVAVESSRVVGLISAMTRYGATGWELHPLVVNQEYRGNGIGSRLVKVLEERVTSCGGVTIFLGCDDESGATSLSNCDLYEDTYQKITEIKNLKMHPYEFYQKQGYKIVGVFPDANGIGKPDIWMSKRLTLS